MEEHELLVRHAQGWATDKDRPLDIALLNEMLDLRRRYDELALGQWPPGSAERLLLVTWPAYGPPLPEPEVLRTTLDTYWGFLRATGRMAVDSASPAELRREAKRALPKMAAAYDDPARHSSGRVLSEFGRTIGIDLDGAADLEEMQGRLDRIQEAWNSLPIEERRRLMPDPSPKGARAEEFTGHVRAAQASYPAWPEPEEADDSVDDLVFEPGDLRRAAAEARASGFVQKCLELVEWVGRGRAVTTRGLLRPQVARGCDPRRGGTQLLAERRRLPRP